MTRVILDTSVLVSSLLYGGVPREIVQRAETGHHLILSPALVDELSATLRKPRFEKFALTDATITALTTRLRRTGEVVDELADVSAFAADPNDTHLLALAVTGRADYLVTGDKALLDLGSYEGTRIVSPRAFLDVLDQQAPPGGSQPASA